MKRREVSGISGGVVVRLSHHRRSHGGKGSDWWGNILVCGEVSSAEWSIRRRWHLRCMDVSMHWGGKKIPWQTTAAGSWGQKVAI